VSRRYRGKPQEVRRVLVCQRCTVQRHDGYHVGSWAKISTTYRYPDGYLLAGTGYVRGEDVRAEIFQRVLPLPTLADLPVANQV
jgi:hypothetical protein